MVLVKVSHEEYWGDEEDPFLHLLEGDDPDVVLAASRRVNWQLNNLPIQADGGIPAESADAQYWELIKAKEQSKRQQSNNKPTTPAHTKVEPRNPGYILPNIVEDDHARKFTEAQLRAVWHNVERGEIPIEKAPDHYRTLLRMPNISNDALADELAKHHLPIIHITTSRGRHARYAAAQKRYSSSDSDDFEEEDDRPFTRAAARIEVMMEEDYEDFQRIVCQIQPIYEAVEDGELDVVPAVKLYRRILGEPRLSNGDVAEILYVYFDKNRRHIIPEERGPNVHGFQPLHGPREAKTRQDAMTTKYIFNDQPIAIKKEHQSPHKPRDMHSGINPRHTWFEEGAPHELHRSWTRGVSIHSNVNLKQLAHAFQGSHGTRESQASRDEEILQKFLQKPTHIKREHHSPNEPHKSHTSVNIPSTVSRVDDDFKVIAEGIFASSVGSAWQKLAQLKEFSALESFTENQEDFLMSSYGVPQSILDSMSPVRPMGRTAGTEASLNSLKPQDAESTKAAKDASNPAIRRWAETQTSSSSSALSSPPDSKDLDIIGKGLFRYNPMKDSAHNSPSWFPPASSSSTLASLPSSFSYSSGSSGGETSRRVDENSTKCEKEKEKGQDGNRQDEPGYPTVGTRKGVDHLGTCDKTKSPRRLVDQQPQLVVPMVHDDGSASQDLVVPESSSRGSGVSAFDKWRALLPKEWPENYPRLPNGRVDISRLSLPTRPRIFRNSGPALVDRTQAVAHQREKQNQGSITPNGPYHPPRKIILDNESLPSRQNNPKAPPIRVIVEEPHMRSLQGAELIASMPTRVDWFTGRQIWPPMSLEYAVQRIPYESSFPRNTDQGGNAQPNDAGEREISRNDNQRENVLPDIMHERELSRNDDQESKVHPDDRKVGEKAKCSPRGCKRQRTGSITSKTLNSKRERKRRRRNTSSPETSGSSQH